MEKYTTQDLIAELQEYQKPIPPRREGGVTVREWAAAQGNSYANAARQLKDMIDKGLLEREWAISHNGKPMFIYYKCQ